MADLRGLLNRRRVVIATSVCTVIAGGTVTYAMAPPAMRPDTSPLPCLGAMSSRP
jgi:hypothetical protein